MADRIATNHPKSTIPTQPKDELQPRQTSSDPGAQATDRVSLGNTRDAFGKALPETSQQTYEAIMDKLDDFAAQFEESEE